MMRIILNVWDAGKKEKFQGCRAPMNDVWMNGWEDQCCRAQNVLFWEPFGNWRMRKIEGLTRDIKQ